MIVSFETALPEGKRAEAEREAAAHIDPMIYVKMVDAGRSELVRPEDEGGRPDLLTRSDMSYSYEDGVHRFWVEVEVKDAA